MYQLEYSEHKDTNLKLEFSFQDQAYDSLDSKPYGTGSPAAASFFTRKLVFFETLYMFWVIG